MSYTINPGALKEVIESSVKETILREITATLCKEQDRMHRELESNLKKSKQLVDEHIKELKKEAKSMANTMTLQILQKADINGISVEFKL